MVIYRLVRNVMSTVQEVAFAFDYSAKKLHAFFDEREAGFVSILTHGPQLDMTS
jgi:hypothetical protein